MKKIVLTSLIIIALVVGVKFLVPVTTADDTNNNVWGMAWSDNIGWIEFPKEGAWGVNIEIVDDTAVLTGWAWSDNIGWIKFNGPLYFTGTSFAYEGETYNHIREDFPENPKHSARLELSDGSLSGWIRACSATIDGDCISPRMGVPSGNNWNVAGQWDGWIKMDGVTIESDADNPDGDPFKGIAWGSDVVGSIDFEGVFTSFYRTLVQAEDFKIDTYDYCAHVAPGVDKGDARVWLVWTYDRKIEGGERMKVDYKISAGGKNFTGIHYLDDVLTPVRVVLPVKLACDVDSLCYNTNYNLVLEIENEYGYKFTTDPISYRTEPHAYPYPDFSYKHDPRLIVCEEGEEDCEPEQQHWVIYTQEAEIFRSGSPLYSWTLPGGIPASSSSSNVDVRYLNYGDELSATLKVTDGSGFSCSMTKGFRLNPNPEWREIPPYLQQ